ncbi:hypothetical protein [Thioalkalivibrio sp. AKL19]|uniref:hypothetical protein n=1 Tax=Thioalkalivibrio sp. AKL19 TaxID=1266914 RepID=UPI0012DBFBB9|nr:hypothetical protein [Thioalkalivibrio sp. AKL19]
MEKFNLLVGLLFGKLYEEFPVAFRVTPEQFLEEIIEKEDYEGSFDFTEYLESTVRWLETAGYIWVSQDLSDDGGVEFDVVLSENGLETLRKAPKSLEGTASIGERLSNFGKSKASDAVGTLVSLAITSAVSSSGIAS